MKIIYHCYGGTHSSVIAASLHLGILNSERLPSNRELLACPYFDSLQNNDSGKIFFMGKDKNGDEIYIMGCKGAGPLVERVLIDFCKIMGINTKEILLVSTIPCLNIFMKIGGFFSRGLHLVTIGQMILLPGSRMAFKKIRKVVETVKNVQNRSS